MPISDWSSYVCTSDLSLRIVTREALIPLMLPYMAQRTTDAWIAALEAAGVPCSPVNTIDRVFEDPQVKARGIRIELPHPLADAGPVPMEIGRATCRDRGCE